MTTEQLESIKKKGMLERLESTIREEMKSARLMLHGQIEHVPWHTDADLDAMFARLRQTEANIRALYSELVRLDESIRANAGPEAAQ